MKINVLASGSTGNAYEISDGQERILLEAGLSWPALQEAMGYTTTGLRAVLCSHEHGDHSGGLEEAMDAGIDCYMSPGTAEALDLSGHRLHLMEAESTVSIGPWAVAAYEVEHDAAEPLCFYITSPSGDRILYVTDAPYIPRNFAGVTHLMVEANYDEITLRESVKSGETERWLAERVRNNHMGLKRLSIALRKMDLSDVREIILLHLSESNSDAQTIQRRVRRITGRPVRII